MCARAARSRKDRGGREIPSRPPKDALRQKVSSDIVWIKQAGMGYLVPVGVHAVDLANDVEVRDETVKFHMAPANGCSAEDLLGTKLKLSAADGCLSIVAAGEDGPGELARIACGRTATGARGDKVVKDVVACLETGLSWSGPARYAESAITECREVSGDDWVATAILRYPAPLRDSTVDFMLEATRKPEGARLASRSSGMRRNRSNPVSIGKLPGQAEADPRRERPGMTKTAGAELKGTEREGETRHAVPVAATVDAAGLLDDEYDTARAREEDIALEFLRSWKDDKVSDEEARAEVERQREEVRAAREELERERKEFEEERDDFEQKMAQHSAAMEAQLEAIDVITALKEDYIERLHRMRDSLADFLSCVDEVLDYYESPFESEDEAPAAQAKPRTPLEKQLAANARAEERKRALIESQKEKMRRRREGS